MTDTRGIKARLAAGAEAEEELKNIIPESSNNPVYFNHSYVLHAAIRAAKEYREIKDKKLPEDVGWAGDPLPDCTALDMVVREFELIIERYHQRASGNYSNKFQNARNKGR